MDFFPQFYEGLRHISIGICNVLNLWCVKIKRFILGKKINAFHISLGGLLGIYFAIKKGGEGEGLGELEEKDYWWITALILALT